MIIRALGLEENEFVERYSRRRSINWDVTVSDPVATVCLQAVDYFLWALQRFYEIRTHSTTGETLREDRYLNMLWPQCATIHDLHFGERATGTTFCRVNPLTLGTRFPPPKKGKKKMP